MAASLWKALPDEVLVAIARLLLGLDLLQLSHVERRLLRVLSRPELYARRLSQARYQRGSSDVHVVPVRDSALELIPIAEGKRRYALESSFRFGGQSLASESQGLPQSFAPVFWPTDTLFGLFAREDDDARSSPSFTLDAWFSLSSPEQGVHQGGVLLGLQSEKCRERGGHWPDFHCQVLQVDSHMNLYCSVTAEKPCVAAQLEPGRWYHVALVFESRSQKVYVDGELVDLQLSQDQQLESFPYYYAQVGSGYIDGDSVCNPTGSYIGWYDFHGIADDLRVWHEAISAEQIAALARDGGAVLRRPTFSLKRDVLVWMAHGVKKVRCSRPRERWCEVAGECKRADDRESWV